MPSSRTGIYLSSSSGWRMTQGLAKASQFSCHRLKLISGRFVVQPPALLAARAADMSPESAACAGAASVSATAAVRRRARLLNPAAHESWRNIVHLRNITARELDDGTRPGAVL